MVANGRAQEVSPLMFTSLVSAVSTNQGAALGSHAGKVQLLRRGQSFELALALETISDHHISGRPI